jgi:hypothetical protein
MVVVRVFSYADHHREQVKEERGMNMQSKMGRRKCKVRNYQEPVTEEGN